MEIRIEGMNQRSLLEPRRKRRIISLTRRGQPHRDPHSLDKGFSWRPPPVPLQALPSLLTCYSFDSASSRILRSVTLYYLYETVLSFLWAPSGSLFVLLYFLLFSTLVLFFFYILFSHCETLLDVSWSLLRNSLLLHPTDSSTLTSSRHRLHVSPPNENSTTTSYIALVLSLFFSYSLFLVCRILVLWKESRTACAQQHKRSLTLLTQWI